MGCGEASYGCQFSERCSEDGGDRWIVLGEEWDNGFHGADFAIVFPNRGQSTKITGYIVPNFP